MSALRRWVCASITEGTYLTRREHEGHSFTVLFEEIWCGIRDGQVCHLSRNCHESKGQFRDFSDTAIASQLTWSPVYTGLSSSHLMRSLTLDQAPSAPTTRSASSRDPSLNWRMCLCPDAPFGITLSRCLLHCIVSGFRLASSICRSCNLSQRKREPAVWSEYGFRAERALGSFHKEFRKRTCQFQDVYFLVRQALHRKSRSCRACLWWACLLHHSERANGVKMVVSRIRTTPATRKRMWPEDMTSPLSPIY